MHPVQSTIARMAWPYLVVLVMAAPAFADDQFGIIERRPDQIIRVQEDLTKLGYYSGAIDGRIDPYTEDAIEDFQFEIGLSVSGQITDETKLFLLIYAEAEGGWPEFQQQLGEAFYIGDPMIQDYAAAAMWLERAANQGVGMAALLLGSLYGDGQGVNQSNVLAYKWLWIGGSRLADSAALHAAIAVRRRITDTMTPGELDEAILRVREWQPVSER